MEIREKITLSTLVVLAIGLVTYVVIKQYRTPQTTPKSGGNVLRVIQQYRTPKTILLLGGLDNRSGDLDIYSQAGLLKDGVSYSKDVQGFRYNDLSGLLSAISNSKKEMYIVLFSSGCSKSKEVANALRERGYNLNYMFIVEPYAKSSITGESVRDAVSIGVPSKNVIVGRSKATGLGVIPNPTFTPSCSPSHWCSLTEVGKMIY